MSDRVGHRGDLDQVDGSDVVTTSAPYVQVEPQHSWHGELVIRANDAGLSELIKALSKAREGTASVTGIVFASDGEGYGIHIQRIERPADYPHPFYTCEIEYQDYGGRGTTIHCGKCGKPR